MGPRPRPPFPAHLGSEVKLELISSLWVKDLGVVLLASGSKRCTHGPRTGAKIIMSNLGNESEARGSHYGLDESGDTGSACWKLRSVRHSWLGCPCPALEVTARSPRGPDLSFWGCLADRVPALLAGPTRPGARPGLESPGGWERAKAGIEPRSWGQVQIPMAGSLGAPRWGTYPSGRPGARWLRAGQA